MTYNNTRAFARAIQVQKECQSHELDRITDALKSITDDQLTDLDRVRKMDDIMFAAHHWLEYERARQALQQVLDEINDLDKYSV